MSGTKYDEGKLPWHLLPFDAIRAIVSVLAFGAAKYAARNWEAGMDWSRPYAALMRHLTAWWLGERKDPETGFSHLWHAGCCVLFLIAYELRGAGNDDRPSASGADLAPLEDEAELVAQIEFPGQLVHDYRVN
ncbi:MAG TPA: dATP/dGTP diphosphohydrolase domain-containing protein [Lysobacter sp.]|nr:dATP/dGTP diphosphohydrolase domain-containing protein [Lysobacter sp.]